jgi:hypothetical protein
MGYAGITAAFAKEVADRKRHGWPRPDWQSFFAGWHARKTAEYRRAYASGGLVSGDHASGMGTPPLRFAYMDPDFGRPDVKKAESDLMLAVLKDRYERNPGGCGGGGVVRHIFTPEDFLGAEVYSTLDKIGQFGRIRLKVKHGGRFRDIADLGTATVNTTPTTRIELDWSGDTSSHEERGRKFGLLFNANRLDDIFKLSKSVMLTMDPTRHFRVLHISIHL